MLVFPRANIYLCVPRIAVLVVKTNEFLLNAIHVIERKKITYSLPIINFVGAYMYMYDRTQFTAVRRAY